MTALNGSARPPVRHRGRTGGEALPSLLPNSRITDVTRYGSAGPREEGLVTTVAFELDGEKFVALKLVERPVGAYSQTVAAAAISRRDLGRALDMAAEWHRAPSVAALAERAIVDLRELIDCDGVGWNEVDAAAGRVDVRTSPAEYLVPKSLEALNRRLEQHPIVTHVERTGDKQAHTVSEFLTERELHRLELYDEFFRPLGIEDLLAVIVEAEPVIIGIAFTRGRRSYRERDRQLLDLLRPHLEIAFHNLQAKAEAERRLELLEHGETQPRNDHGLTGRQVEIVTLAGCGLSDAEIAERLCVSRRTVAKHLEHAYGRLGVRSRIAAARLLDS